MGNKNDKEELEVAQAEDNVVPTDMVNTAAEEESPEGDNAEEEDVPSVYTPLYDYAVAKDKEANARAAEAARLVEEYKRIAKEGGAATNALLLGSKPKRDEEKEKRLSNLAKIQAWGDMLGALTSGVAANTGKYGVGHIPYLPKNSALNTINELNKMQEEYAKRKLAWDNDMLNYNLGQEKSKIEAAKALATNAQKDAADARKEAERAKVDAIKMQYDMVEFEAAETGRNARTMAEIQSRERIKQMELAADKALKDGDTHKWTEDEKKGLRYRAYNELFPYTPSTKVSKQFDSRGKMTGYSTSQGSYSEDTKRRMDEAQINELAIAVERAVTEGGDTYEEAMARVRAYMQESPYVWDPTRLPIE